MRSAGMRYAWACHKFMDGVGTGETEATSASIRLHALLQVLLQQQTAVRVVLRGRFRRLLTFPLTLRIHNAKTALPAMYGGGRWRLKALLLQHLGRHFVRACFPLLPAMVSYSAMDIAARRTAPNAQKLACHGTAQFHCATRCLCLIVLFWFVLRVEPVTIFSGATARWDYYAMLAHRAQSGRSCPLPCHALWTIIKNVWCLALHLLLFVLLRGVVSPSGWFRHRAGDRARHLYLRTGWEAGVL